MKRDLQIPVRLSAVERDVFESRAGDVGLTLGAWMRMVCRESVNADSRENGADSPFTAPASYKTLIKHMEAACRVIALRWDSLPGGEEVNDDDEAF